MRIRLGCLAVVVAVGVAAASPKTPETSRLFVKEVDPETEVASYLLKPALTGFHQQSLYFTAKSMTKDGRFLLFYSAYDEFATVRKDAKGDPQESPPDIWSRPLWMVDFLKDEVHRLKDWDSGGEFPFLDVKANRLYYIGADKMSLWMRDLVANPDVGVKLCSFDRSLLDGAASVDRMCTHLTMSPDRKRAFLDYSLKGSAPDRRYHDGVLDVETGKVTDWAVTAFCSNHGSLNPSDPNLGLYAYEGCWDRRLVGPDGKVRTQWRPECDVFPRVWLCSPAGSRLVVPKIWNRATHENFSDDGKLVYWCCCPDGGVCAMDLETGRQRRICPYSNNHAYLSANNKWVVVDRGHNEFRGRPWSVAFWNRETFRGVYVHTKRPAIATPSRQSHLHPDAHPQFVCGDRYLVMTANDDERRMNVCVTPVDQLVRLTTDPATAPRPKQIPIGWNPSARIDVPYEVELDCASLAAQGKLSPPSCRAKVPWTAFAVAATDASSCRRLITAECLQSTNPMGLILRFSVPKGTTSLFAVADAPCGLEMLDSEGCDNAFDGCLRALPKDFVTDPSVRWKGDVTVRRDGLSLGQGGSSCDVPVSSRLAGRPFKCEIDLRTLSDSIRNISVSFYADGESVFSETVDCSVDVRCEIRGRGTCPSRAKRLSAVVTNPATDRVLLSRLNLRPAGTLVCE
ncbi:MAG: hypothetical protein IJH50_09810 [Kiritimatiellae bacterium]|nr:hypothetical protein [Kiritimatiellia bacterium]